MTEDHCTLDRRTFLKEAGAKVGLLAASPRVLPALLGPPALIHKAAEIVVIGAGA